MKVLIKNTFIDMDIGILFTETECPLTTTRMSECIGEEIDLWKACQMGNLDKFKEILIKNNNDISLICKPDREGIPPLHWAALNGRWIICKYLLDQGAQADALGGEQASPAIHWAICKGHSSTVSLLIRYGADWRVRDQQGYNSIHVAAQNDQDTLILLLKAQGADINSLDRAGRSPLLWAAYRGHSQVVELLIKQGACLDQQDETGRSPLHWAVIKGHAACAAKLLKFGAALNLRDLEGKLPADWAEIKQVSWFDKLNKITLDYRKYQSKPRGKTAELIGTKIIPCLITPILLISFVTIPTWWWSTLVSSVIIFGLYNLSAQILIPAENALPETSFMSFYNYSTLLIVMAVTFCSLLPSQLGSWPFLSTLCASFASITMWSLYKLKFSDPGKLALPRDDSDKDRIICQLASDDILDKRHFCTTCSIRKPLRSKHCKTCDRCVGKFDHHCPWINNCVGSHNHRTFMIYLYSCIGFSFTFLPLAWDFMHTKIDQSIKRPDTCFLLSDQLCKASIESPILFWSFNFGIFMTFWLMMLMFSQTYQVFKNLTTNELSNYSRLEYFYPQLNPDDVPFEAIKDSDKSRRYVNVFDNGIVMNWLDFWKHPLTRKYNYNKLEYFLDEDLRHARIKKQLKKRSNSRHERSSSATSIPIIKNLINNFKKKDCSSCAHHSQNPNPRLQSNPSKQPLLEGLNMV